jgi:hypothetical protein
VALAGALVTPAWFILIEESRRTPPAPAAPREPLQALVAPLTPATPPQPPRAAAASPPPRPDDGPMPVRGRVLDLASGLPLDGLSVAARRAEARAERGLQPGERAVSGEDGRFELSLPPGAWLVACEGGAQEELVKVLPGSGAELQLLALRPPLGPLLRLLDPQGQPLALPAVLVSVVGADGARVEARARKADEAGVRLPPLPAGPSELRVWPGDPRWLPWRGPLPAAPLEVRLRPAPGLPLRLRLADDHQRADVQVFDAASDAVLAQRIGVGPPDATTAGDERALLWTGPGLATALPDGGREVRVVVGLSAEAAGPLRVVVTAHRPLRHGQHASQALSRVERRLPAGEEEALLDLR